MFEKLFRKEEQEKTIADAVVDNNYAHSVEEIHHEFESAGQKLLVEARRIIAETKLGNLDKAARLKAFGFSNVKEVVETDAAEKIRQTNQKLANLIEKYSSLYPNYKFITEEVVEKICNKYGLVKGSASLFKGFVPEKNLKEIEKFFASKSELTKEYYRFSRFSGEKILCSKQQWIDQQNLNKNLSGIYYSMPFETIQSERTQLEICAPLKDMNIVGHKVEGYKIEKIYPDPIVLCPVREDGVTFYLIITAWGDEASDSEIVNPTHN